MQLTMEGLRQAMEAENYICEQQTVITVYLALQLEKPLLITGAPGVGKTEMAKVLSKIFAADLVRLQCYEGLDENRALYEWNYQRQLLRIQMSKEQAGALLEEDLFSKEYLLERPLLKAIMAEKKPVLLIDEIDKTDEEFEAFLFELLSDFQVSIPELGTLRARQIPIVVLTSNGERDLSDGLKRRCVFLHISYPSREKELKIIRAKVPGIGEKLAKQVAAATSFLRSSLNLNKQPAISETLDWARALMLLQTENLQPENIRQTTNLLFKDQEDLETFERQLGADGLCRQLSQG